MTNTAKVPRKDTLFKLPTPDRLPWAKSDLLRSVRARRSFHFPPKVISPLRRGRGSSCSCSRVCRLLGIDEILDRSDLHFISGRLEREDENGFIGE